MLALNLVAVAVLLPAVRSQLFNIPRLPETTGGIDSLFPASFQSVLQTSSQAMRNLAIPDGLQAIANLIQPGRQSNSGQSIKGPNVRFFLFADPSNPNLEEELFVGDLPALQKSHYNASKPVKFLFHGYLETRNYRFIFPWTTKNAYFETGQDYNIILVDYSRTTGFLNYGIAIFTSLIESIDQGTAFIEWLLDNNLISLDETHMIGYSLGSQVSAAIAASLKERRGPIGRLTGIDPAGPGFYPYKLAPHVISKNDAKYVDVYHANAMVVGLGIQKSVGHADFYVNGGQRQPLCVEDLCSHLFAPYFFEDSIRKGADNPERCACKSKPRSLDSYRQCCDVKVTFGEYINGTVGEYYVPFPTSEVLPTITTALGTTFRDVAARFGL